MSNDAPNTPHPLNRVFKIVATLLYILAALLATLLSVMVAFAPDAIAALPEEINAVIIALWGYLAIVTGAGQIAGEGPGTEPPPDRDGTDPPIISGEGPGNAPPPDPEEEVPPIGLGGGRDRH